MSADPLAAADPGRRRLAHEIRNSLGAIRSAAELLQRRYQAEGRQQRLFAVILDEIDRLTALTDAELGGRAATSQPKANRRDE